MEKELTVKEVLQLTIDMLSNIRVPAGMTNEIAIPIMRSIDNLKACQGAITPGPIEQGGEVNDTYREVPEQDSVTEIEES